ncbi:hypothetical protein DERA104750_12520 [Deinococcus radiodurans]|nr:hypothetical protein DRO_0874 [Deinococcus radiodurans R1 = ATCC 13939 = DSM 20539]
MPEPSLNQPSLHKLSLPPPCLMALLPPERAGGRP